MRTLIIGASRLGTALAGDLLRSGHDVRVLDPDRLALAALPETLAPHGRLGSPLQEQPLTEAARGCDSIVAVTGDDAVNAVVALAARRRLRTPHAIAVIADPGRAEALLGLGIGVVCPTTRTARELQLALVRSDVQSELLLAGRIAVCRADVPERLSGRTLADLERPGQIVAIAVEREGRALMAVPALTLAAGDVLHAAATDRELLAELVRP